MNKFVKGSIAAAAATVLLLGGAGSLAYWNSSTGLSVASISTGKLTIVDSGGSWTGAPAVWVPGDEAVYTTTLTIDAAGTNIEGTLELDDTSLAITGATAGQFDVSFAAAAPTGTTWEATGEVLTITTAGQYQVPVTVTVSFPYGASADNTSQNATVNLSNLSFLLTQTDPGL